jgi:hypothetical protein
MLLAATITLTTVDTDAGDRLHVRIVPSER